MKNEKEQSYDEYDIGEEMTGKTHLALGTASALVITQPGSVKELILCLGAASVGSLISDIDVTTSKSRDDLNKITGLTIFIIVLIGFMEYRWNIGIRNSFDQNSNMVRFIAGFLIFLGVCTYGKLQPHRSFMHSILAVIILSGVLYVIFPIIVPYFAVAMISHIVIDMLNYIDVRIFYPLKGGISLNICHANGLINNLIFKASIVVVAVKTIMLLYNFKLLTMLPF